MFLFKKIKGKRRLKTQASLEVLSRLNNYLDENVEEPVEFLVGFWKDQEDAFTYKEIRQAILDGAISEETMRLWMQDYSILVAEKMYPVWEKALAAGPFGQPIMDAFADEFVFDTHTASVLSWINERGADFITAVTQEQKKAIKAMLARHVDGTYTVDELSRVIRPCIGLTESQAKANLRYYDSVKAKLLEQHPKMKPENARKKAREAAMKYAEKQHRQRAYRILRFDDEIRHGEKHSKEHFDQIIEDIDKYEDYCRDHPKFPNNKVVFAIRNIKNVYQKCTDEGTFL